MTKDFWSAFWRAFLVFTLFLLSLIGLPMLAWHILGDIASIITMFVVITATVSAMIAYLFTVGE
jgi:hypothetical protein